MEPDEIIILPARLNDADGIARVHVESWRTTYGGIIPEEYIARQTYEKRLRGWNVILSDPDEQKFTLVVEDRGQIVGMACGGRERAHHPMYAGELVGIYLLQSYQRQGIGRRLVAAVVERLMELGLNSMLVWVLAENPSRLF